MVTWSRTQSLPGCGSTPGLSLYLLGDLRPTLSSWVSVSLLKGSLKSGCEFRAPRRPWRTTVWLKMGVLLFIFVGEAKILFFFFNFCLCACVHVGGTGITSNCEPPDVGAGNRTLEVQGALLTAQPALQSQVPFLDYNIAFCLCVKCTMHNVLSFGDYLVFFYSCSCQMTSSFGLDNYRWNSLKCAL